MLLSSPAGNDLLFDESLCEQGRNFANKIWNAFRLVKGWSVDTSLKQNPSSMVSVAWFASRFEEQLAIINDHYSKHRMSDALMATYKLIWDDFCSWYLEMVKPEFVDGQALPVDQATYEATIGFFEQLLKVVHPWMPFISEELWSLLGERKEKDCIIVASWPSSGKMDETLLKGFEIASEVISQLRNLRKQKNISPKEKLSLYFNSKQTMDPRFNELVCKLGNLDQLNSTDVKVDNAIPFIVQQYEFYVPLTAAIDLKAEKERLLNELEYNKGFLKSVQAKLANERFVSNAKPEVVENEKKKQADAEAKIKAIEEQLANLS